MISFILGLVVILGMMVAPFMTVGAIMCHYNHEILGIILIVFGVINMLIKSSD